MLTFLLSKVVRLHDFPNQMFIVALRKIYQALKDLKLPLEQRLVLLQSLHLRVKLLHLLWSELVGQTQTLSNLINTSISFCRHTEHSSSFIYLWSMPEMSFMLMIFASRPFTKFTSIYSSTIIVCIDRLRTLLENSISCRTEDYLIPSMLTSLLDTILL